MFSSRRVSIQLILIVCIIAWDQGEVWAKGETIYAGKDPISKKVCRTLLTEENVRWVGPSETGDIFSVPIPSHLGEVKWNYVMTGGAVSISSAVFDFANSGNVTTVFRAEVQTSTIVSMSYIVSVPEEEKDLLTRLEGIPGQMAWDEKLGQLIEELSTSKHFKSKVYDTSGAEVYKDSYTTSQVFIHEGKTFVLAQALYNRGGPTAAVFQPSPDGSLDLLCSFKAGPSKRKLVKSFQSKRHACPATEFSYPKISGEIPISWEKMSETIDTTTMEFPGWDSSRRLFRMTSIGGHYQYQHIFVEPPGKNYLQEVEKNLFQGSYPFSGLDDVDFLFGLKFYDSVWVARTKSAIYIVTDNYEEGRAEDSLGTTFHTIEQGKLVAVCKFVQRASYKRENR